jgi:hypothetical protein
MDQNTLFDTTQAEIAEFRKMLKSRLNDRKSETADAIDRNDAWGTIAGAARSDMKDSDLSDLHDLLSDFAESMQESEDNWQA